MNDHDRGIYRKYDIRRTDGSSGKGGKHENCFYFVLDTHHDPHAIAALEAYAASCKTEYPHLAKDLKNLVREMRARFSTKAASKKTKEKKA